MSTLLNPYFGEFGGMYVPQILMPALRQLEEANKEMIEMNDTKKEILYMIGLLYEKLGRKEESLAAFQQIYDAEYGYRDVAQRVESSYSK